MFTVLIATREIRTIARGQVPQKGFCEEHVVIEVVVQVFGQVTHCGGLPKIFFKEKCNADCHGWENIKTKEGDLILFWFAC